jgi:hypothetical protein
MLLLCWPDTGRADGAGTPGPDRKRAFRAHVDLAQPGACGPCPCGTKLVETKVCEQRDAGGKCTRLIVKKECR